MPKIRVELEVPEKYCDEPYNTCPMCVDDGVAAYCVAFNYALEEEDFHCKRLKACKKAENARLTEKLKKETAKEILQEWADDNSSMGLDNTFVKNIAKKYGVEVKE
jgi:hypothetical protein